MIPENTPTKQTLTELCKAFEKITREASAAEAAVTAASEDYKIAKIDDGETDPAEIFERKTAAKKRLFICQSEANRAKKRLDAATSEFEESVEAMAPALLARLAEIRDRNTAALTKELASKLPQNDMAKPTLSNFVARCVGVIEYNNAIQTILTPLERLESNGVQDGRLIRALKQAEILL